MAFRQVRNDLLGAWVRAADANVEFRKQCQAIHDAFSNSGWVQTADTGQINLTTVNGPANDVFAGYEIWQMNDTLQATSPIFLKIEYGAGGFVGGTLAIRVQIGNGSSGTGGLLGNLTAGPGAGRISITTSSTTGDWVNTHYWLLTGDTDRILVAFNFTGPANTSPARAWLLSIERAVDETGTRVGGAFLSGYSTRDGDFQEYVHPFIGGVGQELEFGILVARSGMSGLKNGVPSVFPQYLSRYNFLPAGINQMGVIGGAIPTHSLITVPRYGVDHVYYSLGTKFAGDSAANASLCKTGVRFASNTKGVTLIARYDP